MNKEKSKTCIGWGGKLYTIEEREKNVVYVNATEFSKGHSDKLRPSNWLALKETKRFIAQAAKSNGKKQEEMVFAEAGKGTWMHEEVALEYAEWLKPQKGLRGWLNTQIKTLKIEMENLRAVERHVKNEADKKAEAEGLIPIKFDKEEADKKKVEYCEKVLSSQSSYTVSQIAKELGMSAIRLNELLHDKGIQYKRKGQWLLYAKYQDKEYVKTATFIQEHSNGNNTFQVTQWTEKGREFIHQLMNKHKQETVPTEEVPKIEEKKKEDIVLNIEPPTYEELEEIISTYADMTDSLRRENKELQRRIQEMEKQMAKYKQMTTTFRDVALSVISTMGKDESPFIVPKIPVESSTYEAIGV